MSPERVNIGRDVVAEVEFGGRQIVGKRANQEDAYGIVPPADMGELGDLLVIVADGMGGHAAGEVASEMAVDSFALGFFDEKQSDDGSRMWEGLERANREIGRMIENRPELQGMGTTLVGLLLRGGMARWISVGDSPLYLVRDGSLRRLNQLHLEDGGGEPGENVVHEPQGKSATLNSALVGGRIFFVDDQSPVPLAPGDIIVAASDGLDTLSNRDLLEILQSEPDRSPGAHAEALLEAVERQGHPRQDNTTSVVVKVY